MGLQLAPDAPKSHAGFAADGWRPLARKLLGELRGAQRCTGNTLHDLIDSARIRKFDEAQVLGLAGNQPGDLGLLLDGLIEESTPLSDGRKQLVAILGPGDLTGLPSLMDDGGLGHDLCAKTACTLALIPIEGVREAMQKDGELCMVLARHLSGMHRSLEDRLAAQSRMPLESRVSVMLQSLSERHGLLSNEGIRIELKLSQADLADWVGVSRQRVNEALKTLENERIISLRYSALTVTDPVGLRSRARR